ncbi:MAG: ribosome recycling factor [Acidiferrobacterales bacterium]|nr:ribosome recycling factor [Acidiferrobacterales bacterium]
MTNDVAAIKKDAERRMAKSIETLNADLAKIRTGRAHAGLLDHIKVNYYGNPTPLNQVASITVSDSRTLTVTPWDKNAVAAVERAIRESDLGLNPATSGQTIRIPLPPLTEERRQELAKVVRSEGENTKVAIRNVRRDCNHHVKELLKKKSISEDEDRRAEESIQKSTDRFVAEVDKLVAAKEQEIMTI